VTPEEEGYDFLRRHVRDFLWVWARVREVGGEWNFEEVVREA
jgi:hypothetical protein